MRTMSNRKRTSLGGIVAIAAPLVALALVLAACKPEGNLDAAVPTVEASNSTAIVAGWAWDQDAPDQAIAIHVYVDGGWGGMGRADRYRPDVASARPAAGPRHGYRIEVPVGPGTHEVCAYGINVPGTSGDNAKLGCTKVFMPSAPDKAVAWQTDMVDQINGIRAAAGVAPLARCATLDAAAADYATTMANQRWFSTDGPDGSDQWSRLTGYAGVATGENIAFGHPDTPSVLSALLASSAEKANLLRSDFTHVGISRVVGDPDGDGPEPQGIYWVQEFGVGGNC